MLAPRADAGHVEPTPGPADAPASVGSLTLPLHTPGVANLENQVGAVPAVGGEA